MVASQEDRQETLRWAVLATHLNGALDSGDTDRIDPKLSSGTFRGGDLWSTRGANLGRT